MRAFFNKFRIRLLAAVLAAIAGSAALLSCDKDSLEIQQNFPFELQAMPVPKDIARGGTAEIRLTIQPAGSYSGTRYFIRYFQYSGQGTLRYYNEQPYQPNDLYQIPAQDFRLYYTSNSAVSQSFTIWVTDNFGNEKQLSFEFNSID